MTERKSKRPILIFVLILVMFGLKIFSQQKEIKKIKEETKLAEENEKILEKEIESITNKINNSESIEYIEKIAREEYGMVKDNEIIYVDENREKKEKDVFGR